MFENEEYWSNKFVSSQNPTSKCGGKIVNQETFSLSICQSLKGENEIIQYR